MLTKLCAKCGRVMGLGSALCPACQAKADERHKQYDNNVRDKAAARFYHSAQWIRLRDYTMAQAGYQCAACRRSGKVTPADEVHHIIPLSVDWPRRLDPANLVCLCHQHHMEAHAKLRGCARRGDGKKFDSLHD